MNRLRALLGMIALCGAFGRLAHAQGKPVPLASPSPSDERVLGIYKPDGSIQCDQLSGVLLSTMAKELTDAGVTILSKERRPGRTPVQCGSPTNTLNYFSIALGDLGKVDLHLDHPGHFNVYIGTMQTVLVVTSGMVRCGEPPIHPDTLASRLASAGVVPIQQTMQKAPLDPVRCAGTAYDNIVFRVALSQLATAKTLGFREMPTRTALECIGAVAPPPGSPEATRMMQPQSRFIIIPPLDGMPPDIRGKQFETIFFVSAIGVVDSVTAYPLIPPSYANKFGQALKGYRWAPATFDGCPVAASGTMQITFPR